MKTYRSYGNYVTKPVTLVKSKLEAYVGWNGISQVIDENIGKGKRVFVMDLYPGVEESQVKEKIERMYENAEVIGVSEALYSYERLDDIFCDYITKDRVFGYMTGKSINHCFIKEKLLDRKSVV